MVERLSQTASEAGFVQVLCRDWSRMWSAIPTPKDKVLLQNFAATATGLGCRRVLAEDRRKALGFAGLNRKAAWMKAHEKRK
jgi:hypothetical protein